MMQTEIEAELAGLRNEIAVLQARDEVRQTGICPIAKGVHFSVILFAIVVAFGVAAAAWTGRSDLMLSSIPSFSQELR
jgi:hypothetical protein